MGDGSACRTPKAPGYLDGRRRALRRRRSPRRWPRPTPQPLAGLDAGLADELLAAGRAPWQVLAGAAEGPASGAGELLATTTRPTASATSSRPGVPRCGRSAPASVGRRCSADGAACGVGGMASSLAVELVQGVLRRRRALVDLPVVLAAGLLVGHRRRPCRCPCAILSPCSSTAFVGLASRRLSNMPMRVTVGHAGRDLPDRDRHPPASRRRRRRRRRRRPASPTWPSQLARAARRRGGQRRLDAALPRHGHRHRQADRRPSGAACRTTCSTSGTSPSAASVAEYQRLARAAIADIRRARRAAGAGRRLRALRARRARRPRVPRHRPGAPGPAGGASWPTRGPAAAARAAGRASTRPRPRRSCRATAGGSSARWRSSR